MDITFIRITSDISKTNSLFLHQKFMFNIKSYKIMKMGNTYLATVYAQAPAGKKGEFKVVLRSSDKINLRQRLEEYKGAGYDIQVREITEDNSLNRCKEVIIMTGNMEKPWESNGQDIMDIIDAEKEGEKELYDNGFFETLYMTGCEMAEHLLCWDRHVVKVTDCD